MANSAAPSTAAAMGDLFAPAFLRGNPQSEQAVQDWQQRIFNVNPGNIEQTRMPVSFNTGNPAGELDPEALRIMAQGGPYDFNARRNAIAAQVAANQAAAQQQQQPSRVIGPGSPLYIPPNNLNLVAGAYGTPKIAGYDDSWIGTPSNTQAGPGSAYSGGGEVAAGLAPPQVALGVS
jgi:hypothetical protein